MSGSKDPKDSSAPKGDETNPPNPPDDQGNPPGDDESATVPKSLYESTKADLLKYKKEAKDREAELKREKEKKLIDEKNFEALAQQRAEEAEAARTEAETLRASIVSDRKFSVIKEAALKAGILPQSLDDLEMLDFPEIRVESQGDKIIVHGADAAIAGLKVRKPHWFSTKTPNANPRSPGTHPPPVNGAVTLDEVKRLEDEWKKHPQSLDAKKAYESAVFRYKQKK